MRLMFDLEVCSLLAEGSTFVNVGIVASTMIRTVLNVSFVVLSNQSWYQNSIFKYFT